MAWISKGWIRNVMRRRTMGVECSILVEAWRREYCDLSRDFNVEMKDACSGSGS